MSGIKVQAEGLEDIVFYKGDVYSPEDEPHYLEEFEKLREEGKIQSCFEDDVWLTFNGVMHYTIQFQLNTTAYQRHMKKEIGISVSQILLLLRFYVISIIGGFIFYTLAKKVKTLTNFLSQAPGPKGSYVLKEKEWSTIADFLIFASVPSRTIDRLKRWVINDDSPRPRPRTLANLANYLTLDEDVAMMFEKEDTGEKDLICWFPVYLWVKLTFVLPLRATEFILTPFDCLQEKEGVFFIRVRRTTLKGPEAPVAHEVEKDYQFYTYELPDVPLVRQIQRYQKLTGGQKRSFLLERGRFPRDGVFTLGMLNARLADYIQTRLVGNPNYDFIRQMSNIEEFEPVTAGDSRPIAAANLFYQDISADIIRQLLVHVDMTTSFNYYSNVSETVLMSSFIQAQRMINHGYQEQGLLAKSYLAMPDIGETQGCCSLDAPHKTGKIDDCKKYGHLDRCFGCPMYRPSPEELTEELETRKKELDSATRTLIGSLSGLTGMKHLDNSRILLDAQTSIARFVEACQVNAKEEVKKWQRHHPIKNP